MKRPGGRLLRLLEMTLLRAILDRAVAAAGLVLLSPLFATVALAIVLESGLPVLFRQRRIGRFGRPFTLYKFRSMSPAGPGALITGRNDNRITRLGRVLRKYKIDELPQLWNVLRGDMSLVGPRPEVPAFVEPHADVWRIVLAVRPGITDLASLLYRNEEELLAAVDDVEQHYRSAILPEKLALNAEYLQTRSLASDLMLIALTIECSLFPGRWQAGRILAKFERLRRKAPAADKRTSPIPRTGL